MRKTGKLPPELAAKPRLDADAAEYFADFRMISAGREYNDLGAQAVKTSEILAYCQLKGITSAEDRQALLQMVRAMDSAYVQYMIEKRNQNSPKPARK